MIELGTRENGYNVTLTGQIGLEEAAEFALDLEDELAGIARDFVLVLDARTLVHLEPEASVRFEEAIERAVEWGMSRLAVLAVSTAHAQPFFQMSQRLGLNGRYRYLDIPSDPEMVESLDDWLSGAMV